MTPDGTKMYRVYVDFDGAIVDEYVGPYAGIPSLSALPDPEQAILPGDLFIASPGAGIVFPTSSGVFVLRLDNDGAIQATRIALAGWISNNGGQMPDGVDAYGNWVYKESVIVFPFAGGPQGLVMPARGGAGTYRIRIGPDGDILDETP